MKKGILFVISGPSAVGKGTICKELLQCCPDIVYSVSATTRPARYNEIHGKNYFFLKQNEFETMITENAFLEYACVYGNYYGTPRDFVRSQLNEGHHVILEIDTQGAQKVKAQNTDAVYIFIYPPSMDELRNRILARNADPADSIEIRMQSAHKEMALASFYDYIVLNDTVDQAVDKIKSIIVAEECKYSNFSFLLNMEG